MQPSGILTHRMAENGHRSPEAPGGRCRPEVHAHREAKRRGFPVRRWGISATLSNPRQQALAFLTVHAYTLIDTELITHHAVHAEVSKKSEGLWSVDSGVDPHPPLPAQKASWTFRTTVGPNPHLRKAGTGSIAGTHRSSRHHKPGEFPTQNIHLVSGIPGVFPEVPVWNHSDRGPRG